MLLAFEILTVDPYKYIVGPDKSVCKHYALQNTTGFRGIRAFVYVGAGTRQIPGAPTSLSP